jgi:hypothetical protein
MSDPVPRGACVVAAGEPLVHWRSSNRNRIGDNTIHLDWLTWYGYSPDCEVGIGITGRMAVTGSVKAEEVTCLMCLVKAV